MTSEDIQKRLEATLLKLQQREEEVQREYIQKTATNEVLLPGDQDNYMFETITPLQEKAEAYQTAYEEEQRQRRCADETTSILARFTREAGILRSNRTEENRESTRGGERRQKLLEEQQEEERRQKLLKEQQEEERRQK